jgi:hypothetical protein
MFQNLKHTYMNLLRLAFCAILALSLASCDKDDDIQKDCTQADWVGVYVGTIECGGVSEGVTVTITASGASSIVIAYETNTLTSEYDPLMPNKCDLNVSDSGGGTSISVDANINNGKFTMDEMYTISGTTVTCKIDASRQ